MDSPSHTCPAGGVVHTRRLQLACNDQRQVTCTVCGDLGWVEDRAAAADAARRHMAEGGSDGRLTEGDLTELAVIAETIALGHVIEGDHDEAARLRQLAARARAHAAPATDERARIRDLLITESRLDRLRHEAAQRAAGTPYADNDSVMKYREVWGHWCGINRAIDIIDRLDKETRP